MQDDALLVHRPEEQVARSLDDLVALGVRDIRVTAAWNTLAPAPDSETVPLGFSPGNPDAYEFARFGPLDRLVRLATARGIDVLMDVGFYAPRWATSDAPDERRPRQDIDPIAFAAFAAMLARRYSGTYRDLPRVSRFSLWNEPNHNAFLLPQWRRENGRFVPASPVRYRRMVRVAYPAVKAVQPGATVLVGGTSSTGSYSGRGTGPVPPLRFLRDLACVDRRLRPLRTAGCRDFKPLPGDGWSHHPYSLRTLPDAMPASAERDDVPLGALGRLTTTLGRLVAAGRLSPGLAQVFITEYGYESNPPSRLQRWTAGDQALFLAWSEYLAWRHPAVRSFAQFLIRDTPPAPLPVSASVRRPYGDWGSGLFFANGRPKLARIAFSAGLYVRNASRGRALVWGHLRNDRGVQTISLERRARSGAPWVAVPTTLPGRTVPAMSFSTQPDGVFQRIAPGGRGARYRIRYGPGRLEASISFRGLNVPLRRAPAPPGSPEGSVGNAGRPDIP